MSGAVYVEETDMEKQIKNISSAALAAISRSLTNQCPTNQIGSAGLMKTVLATDGWGGGLDRSGAKFWHEKVGVRYYESSVEPRHLGERDADCGQHWLVFEPGDLEVVAWRSARSQAMLIAWRNVDNYIMEYVPPPEGGDSMYRLLFENPWCFKGKSGAGYVHHVLEPKRQRAEFVGPLPQPHTPRVRKVPTPPLPQADDFVEVSEGA